jgi:spore coat polysaccharide biosynthesis protein SpsF
MSKKPHIVAVVQARMRSSRLPGKVLKPIVGQPLLWHILHRLQKSQLIGTICVATTSDPSDDALAAYAEGQGAVVVRGPEDDVLGRFALAAHIVDPDIIVRVCADAPLVDAGFIDFLISELMRTRSDFVMLKEGLSAIHDGAECMSRVALDKLVLKAHDDPVAREHVSAYFRIHQDFVKVAHVDLPQKWAFKGARLSIDTPADVAFIEAIYERLHAQAGEATLTDLVALLNREPSLMALNAHVQQKTPTQSSGTVIMRCDGGDSGFDQVRRCLKIGSALRDRQGLGVRFAMWGDSAAVSLVESEGFPVDVIPSGAKEIDWLLDLAGRRKPVALVLDIRTELSATSVMRLRGADMIVATLDDRSPRRLSADAAFYPPMPEVFGLDWRGAEAEPCVGWEWIVTAAAATQKPASKMGRKRVVVSMSGDNGADQTVMTVRALVTMGEDFDATVVLGANADRQLERDVATLAPHYAVVRGTSELPGLLANADLGLIQFGPAALELATHGVPAIYLCGDQGKVAAASVFEQAGMGVSLGVMSESDTALIGATVAEILFDAECLRSMSAAGRMNLDGRADVRIAQLICRLVEERNEALRIPEAQRQALAV